ncbi:MFS transporter [Streptomyces sp. URMC 129]|uniref:MFS transporter n=1 Tax=Streptomyces sp. URMC 129 TaxID=3423407 RepID=UPI003F1CE8AD
MRSRAKAVLISVVGLHLVAETALTPFLPQLFERLYGIEDAEATGLYLWVCRIVGLAALPLWGLAARRWPLHRLVLAGLCGSAVLDLLLGMAPSYAAYTVLSTLIVATNCALLLAYPAFIAEHGDDGEDGGERARLAGLCSVVVVFHLSVVVATVVGAGVLALPEPRVGISAFAVVDAVLAVLTYRVLGRAPAASPAAVPGAVPEEAAVPEPDAAGAGPRRRTRLIVLAYAALVGLAFDFSVNVARPFFTEFSDGLGGGAAASAVLFFLPSVAALAVLPTVRRCHEALGDRLLPLAMAVGAAGLAWQALADSLPHLVGGRLLFGVGLGLGQVSVELWMFRATGTKGPAYTAVETARSVGLLAAPIAATAAVSHDLAFPLVVAAAIQACAVVLTLSPSRTGAPAPARTGAAVAVAAGPPRPAPLPAPAPALATAPSGAARRARDEPRAASGPGALAGPALAVRPADPAADQPLPAIPLYSEENNR